MSEEKKKFAEAYNEFREVKAGGIGCFTMLAGPLLLLLAGFVAPLPQLAANIITQTALFLPAAGAVFAIIALFGEHKHPNSGRGFAIATLIMCNPLFYLIYCFICQMSYSTLSGLSWM